MKHKTKILTVILATIIIFNSIAFTQMPILNAEANTEMGKIVQVSAGEQYTLALDENGIVWACGGVNRSTPAQVAGLEGVVSVAAGGGIV